MCPDADMSLDETTDSERSRSCSPSRAPPGASSAGNASSFNKKATELINTMKRYGVSGYGNVLNAKDAALHLGNHENVTTEMIDKIADDPNIKGIKRGKPVHRWLNEIITDGACSYTAHIIATRDPI